MSRRKGEITDKHRRRTHPFQVEMHYPGQELGRDMHAMMRWCAMHDYVRTGSGKLDKMRWCFKSTDKADAFQAVFGGIRLDQPIDPVYYQPEREPDARELARRKNAALFGLEIIEAARPNSAEPAPIAGQRNR